MSNQMSASSSKSTAIPVNSHGKTCTYSIIRLENGLTALLISSSYVTPYKNHLEFAPAEVSLSINVGSSSDPEEFQGLAHLLEHMLSKGTRKFPGINDFDNYLEKTFGYYNACCEQEVTNFFLKTKTKYLEGSLKRFAEFFIYPLIRKSAVIKELEAVDSEFSNKNSDEHRFLSLLKSLGESGHPATKFHFGNRESLMKNKTYDDLVKELRKFRLRHYSANRMKLVIRTNLILDNLEKMIREIFKEVHNNLLPPTNFSEYKNSFNTEKFKKIYYVKPVNNLCQVRLSWPIPPEANLYRYQANDYICKILDYKGPGGLFAYLRNRMWALSVELYDNEDNEINNICPVFTIKILLTHQGMDNLLLVLCAVFSYLALLKRHGPCPFLFNILKRIGDTTFKYDYIFSDIMQVSKRMFTFQPKDYFNYSKMYFDYNEELIRNVIACLNAETCNIMVYDYRMDRENYTKTEKWFGTAYTYKSIPENWRMHWKEIKPFKEFFYPFFTINTFSPADFRILDKRKGCTFLEKKLKEKECFLFYDDIISSKPKATLSYYFGTTFHQTSARHRAMLDLYVAILKHCAMEKLFFARAACQCYSFKQHTRGLNIIVHGISDNLSELMNSITEMLIKCVEILSLELFESIKIETSHFYHEYLMHPLTLVKHVLNMVICDNFVNMFERRKVLKNISLSELQLFVKEFYASATIVNEVKGNISEERASALLNNLINETDFIKDFPSFKSELNIKGSPLPIGEQTLRIFSFDKNNNNSVVRSYYQLSSFNIPDYCMIELLMKMMKTPLFHQLRTTEKLGYHPYCQMYDLPGILGFHITLLFQETKFRSSYVQERIEVFLQKFKYKIIKKEDEWFKGFIDCSIRNKQESSIHSSNHLKKYDNTSEEITFLQSVTASDIRSWYLHNLNPEFYKKITILIVGHNKDTTSSSIAKCS